MRILITGASGFIGSQLGQALAADHDVLGTVFRSRTPLPFPFRVADLTDERAVADMMRDFKPQVIVHATALSHVLDCEQDPNAARKINVEATGRLTRWAERVHTRLIFLSSDQVFSGKRGMYLESDPSDPINVYGRTKLEAEHLVLANASGNLVVRSNSVVGPSKGRGDSFSDWILRHLSRGEKVSLFHDQYRSPIHVRQLVRLLHFVCMNPTSGILHAGGLRRMSRADLGYALARSYGLAADCIEVTDLASHASASVMPRDTSFNVARLRQVVPQLKMRPLDDEFVDDARAAEIRA
jgi:dTDP-4-dehydrorhamnose reductase